MVVFLVEYQLRIDVILLLLVVQSISGKRPRGRSSYGRRHPYYGPTEYFPRYPPITRRPFTTIQPPTTTPEISTISEEDDKDAADFGIKIPPDECIISWDQFKENVPGKQYAEIMDIEYDEAISPGRIRKAQLQFSIVNDSVIRRHASLQIADADSCIYIFGIDKRDVDSNKAIFTPLSGNDFVLPGRRDFVVSSDPSRYIFYFFCFEYDKRKNDRCPTGIVILLVKDDRDWPKTGDGIPEGKVRLNDVPWGDIEETMKKCFLQQMVDDTDPQANWVWKGRDCAVPGSDVHTNGIKGP